MLRGAVCGAGGESKGGAKLSGLSQAGAGLGMGGMGSGEVWVICRRTWTEEQQSTQRVGLFPGT